MTIHDGARMPTLGAALLAFLVLLISPTQAKAEINCAESVEWMTMDADLVVRGVVTQVQARGLQSGQPWHRVTLRVKETLKPAPATTRRRRTRPAGHLLRFIIRGRPGNDSRAWKRNRVDLLLFLVKRHRLPPNLRAAVRLPYALRRTLCTGESAIRLSGSRPGQVYTRDFRVLKKPADILRATAAAARQRRAQASHRVDVPSSPAQRALYAGSAVWLYLPRDAHLRRLAHTWLKSPSVHRRVEGVKILATHRSAATVKVLRRLLTDTSHWVETTGARHGSPRTRVYAVREAAYQALRAWKIRVPKPVTRVRLP